MQQTLSTPSQPEPENKCLGCLFMKLEAIPVQSEPQGSIQRQPNSTAIQQVNLHLTLLFNEQRELLIGGRIKFGLKGGKLKLKLENGEIPRESSKLAGLIEFSIQKPSQSPQGSENQSDTTKTSFTGSQRVTTVNSGINQTKGRTENLQFSVCQVTINGSQENPTWIFEVEKGEPVLKGLLNNVLLATLNVTEKPYCVEATFEVSPQDVCVTEAEGLWSRNISKKRSAVIERAIARRFLERKLKPYLSRHKLRYD